MTVADAAKSHVISTDETWKTCEDISTVIAPYSDWNYLLGPPFMSNNEIINEEFIVHDWKSAEFDDSRWENAIIISMAEKMLPAMNPWTLAPRPIPMLPEIPKRFSSAVKCSGTIDLVKWDKLISEGSTITIPANTTIVVDFDAGNLTTGFLSLQCQKGGGARIKVLCAECYEKDNGKDRSPFPEQRGKGDRTNSATGRLYGTEDVYTAGKSAQDHVFEPFWFRTFRYVQLQITTAEEDLVLTDFTFRETHYPLEITTNIKVSPELESMWDISLRTLKNCMHETYEDCPFYEQNQFVFDGRLQMLFTYQISSDDRLARKTMEEFHASRCSNGLVIAHFPVGFKSSQIPMFSLFFPLMVHDHMLYFGDKSLARKYMGTIDGILNYFDCQLNDLGLVGQFDEEMWPFVDWVQQWTTPMVIKKTGMPPAYWSVGVATIFSLVYSMSLLRAAELCDFLGRKDTGNEYRLRSQTINDAVNRQCFEDGIYLDGPGVHEYSQHSQVFAVLCGAITGPAAKKLMKRTVQDSQLAPCSYAMKFYLFRAVEKVGLYSESFDTLMEPWRMMMGQNLTTWCENDTNVRSDCHGWSAAPIHEIVSGVFGLKPTGPGFQRIIVEPRRSLAKQAKANLWTLRGNITIDWTDEHNLTLEASSRMEVELILDGSSSVMHLHPGVKISCGGIGHEHFANWKGLGGITSWLYKNV
jgi:alpha-L-rhamnosidase